jgi:hypothetical protein
MRRNSDALFQRLHAAALRCIASNNIGVVGKDGRARVVMEWVRANGDMANLLREIGGEIPMHAEKCAARVSPIMECNCGLLAQINARVSDPA